MTFTNPTSLVTALALAGTLSQAAPTIQTTPSTGSPTFEAASIKPNDAGNTGSMISGPAPGRFRAINAPLDRIIQSAFAIRDDQLVGVPSWARAARFDIEATYPDGERPDFARLQGMLQSLLADRFQLKTHPEVRDGATYALVLARRDGRLGPRITPNEIDCRAYLADKSPLRFDGRGDVPLCGPMVTSAQFIKASARPIENLASAIARQVGRPVANHTGLSGNFDFNLEWTPEPSGAAAASNPGGAPATADNAISFITALDEQLGLRLESARGAIDVIVIDHLERPSPD